MFPCWQNSFGTTFSTLQTASPGNLDQFMTENKWTSVLYHSASLFLTCMGSLPMCQTKQSLMLSNTFQDLKCNLQCSFEFVRSEINTFSLTGARSWSIVHYVHWIWRSNIYMWNPTIYNIIHWFAGFLGPMTRWSSVWCSLFFS